MIATSFAQSPNDAVGYCRAETGGVVPRTLPTPTVVPAIAGGMWSTVTDFARLDAALHSGRLLSEHALATLEAPVSSRTRKIGCCWIVSDFLGHRANIDGAHGAGDGSYAIIERFPDDDVITLVFTNLGGSGVFPAADLLSTFALDAGVLNGRLTVVRGWPSLPGPLIPTSQTTFVPTYAPSVELAFEVDATGRATVELPRVGA